MILGLALVVFLDRVLLEILLDVILLCDVCRVDLVLGLLLGLDDWSSPLP